MIVKRILATALPFLLGLCTRLQADTVILKSGDRLEGRILSETEAEVTISMQVTATIKDERVIKRGEIEKIEKVQPDEEAWAVLANYAPGTESLERDDYDRVKTALQNFTISFPKSPHAALARSRLDAFASEQVRVNLGEVKLGGQWLGKEKVREEQIQIGGRILFNRMKRAAAAGQLTEAMAVFDQLEKGFIGSASYPDAVELAQRILPPLAVAVQQNIALLKRRADDEKQRLTNSKGADHAQLEALIKKETATTEATLMAMEKSGVKWLPLQPANPRSLAALTTRATSETSRLNGLPIEKMRASVKASQDAAAALAAGKFDRAETLVKEASSAWSANELAKRTQANLADAKKAMTAPRATPTPAPTPAPKPKAKSSASSSAGSPAPLAATAETEETPFFKKPVFFIVLAVIVAFGTIAGKMIAKARATAADAALDK